jgi:hypothetical protein
MTQMDHSDAVRLQAAEKYVLGEFPQDLRDEYEEHFFECSECAADVKAVAGFVDVSREVLRAEPEKLAETKTASSPRGWLSWFRPVIAVPAFAILLLVIGYQIFVSIPKAKQAAANGASQILFSSHALRGVNTAGEEGRTLSIRPDEAFFLNFDFVPTRSFNSYVAQLEDAEGRVLLRSKIAGGNANQEAHLPIPAGMLRPGKYVLAFYGDPGTRGKIDPQNDAGRLPFIVEFRS